jgi:hypothetical protein
VSFRKLLALAAAGLAPAALALALNAVPARVAAQETVQDEGAAYRAWYDATQANDAAKALAAARAYVSKYPTGQYADAVKKWLLPGEYNLALKEKRTPDTIKFGRELLAGGADDLLVLTQVAFAIRTNELGTTPPNYDHVADAVEFCNKAIPLIEAGKTPAGATNFNKEATLSWMIQVLAINEARAGNPDEAIKLYEKSTALGVDNAAVAGRNLIAVYSIRQTAYGEAVKALNALPEADKRAAEPTPEVKSALDRFNREADALIDSAAAFVVYAKAKAIAPNLRDQVDETLRKVYQSRFPDDATLAGLQKILQEKETALGVSSAPQT